MTSSPTPTHGQSTHGSAAAPTANTGGIKLNGIKPMANTVVPVSELKNDLNVRKKRRDQIDLSNQPMKPNNSTLSVNSFNSSGKSQACIRSKIFIIYLMYYFYYWNYRYDKLLVT
jgi:hypothetical protein